MDKSSIIQQTENYVKSELAGEGSGHDWWHIVRVRNLGRSIAEKEGANPYIVELSTLLHDIADWKFHDGDLSAGSRAARAWLESLRVEEDTIVRVCYIIDHVSFKGQGVASKMETLEGMVVQDADRLDAIGTVGIGRAFAYGGHAGRIIYDPSIDPKTHATVESYMKNKSPTINHFYEKLLLLKDLMNTKTAEKIAEARHNYMLAYLDRFFKEWKGEL
jgi:uncharacterized protein